SSAESPKTAIDAFIASYDEELNLVYKEYQVMVTKKKNPCRDAMYAYRCQAIGTKEKLYMWDKGETVDSAIKLSDEEKVAVKKLMNAKVPGEELYDVKKAGIESKMLATLREKFETGFKGI